MSAGPAQWYRPVLAMACVVAIVACVASGPAAAATAPPAPATASTFTSGLKNPWGMAFLPDGRMLVTQKAGELVIVSADGKAVGAPLSGVPAVNSAGQGGLLDVALDPDFAADPWVYISYSEPGSGGSGTAVARGRLSGNALQDVSVIFRQLPKVSGNGHYGSRLVFGRDKTLFVTLGERQKGSPAQDLASHLGKVVRINRDGSVPAGNPKLGAGARPEIWSYGHRNPQGAALHPTTGELWDVEHGPQGGDEINIARAGANYGWPLRSYGCNYGDRVSDTCRIGGGTHAPEFVEPLTYWVPISIAPSGLAFVTSDRYPGWQGSLLLGALRGQALIRLELDGHKVVKEQLLLTELKERIRDVRQGPDGFVYVLTDNADGQILRLER